jgi:hypothetical protein
MNEEQKTVSITELEQIIICAQAVIQRIKEVPLDTPPAV